MSPTCIQYCFSPLGPKTISEIMEVPSIMYLVCFPTISTKLEVHKLGVLPHCRRKTLAKFVGVSQFTVRRSIRAHKVNRKKSKLSNFVWRWGYLHNLIHRKQQTKQFWRTREDRLGIVIFLFKKERKKERIRGRRE